MALKLGYNHAITMDSDNQHKPEDLPSFLQILETDQLVEGSFFGNEPIRGLNLPREVLEKIYYKNGGISFLNTFKNGQKINRKAYGKTGKLEFDQDYPYKEEN